MRPCGNAVTRVALASLMITGIFVGESADAEVPDLRGDGWHTWRVASAEHAPEWCCYAWNSGRKIAEGCDLDSRDRGLGSRDETAGDVGQIQLYVNVDRGEVEEIRALSPRCTVRADSEIVDLGVVASDDSIDWLRSFVTPQNELAGDALMAISVHEDAVQALIELIGNRDLDMDTREEALFWLAMTDSEDAMAFFERLLVGS